MWYTDLRLPYSTIMTASANDFHNFNLQLTQAIENNDIPAITKLFKDPVFGLRFYEFYLQTSIDIGEPEHFDLLLSFDLPIVSTRPLLTTILAGKIEYFKKLLARAPLPLTDQNLMSTAVLHNNNEMVALLAPRYHTLKDSKALVWAVKSNNPEAFDLVYPLSNKEEALNYLKEQNFRGDGMKMLKSRMKQERLHEKLSQATSKMVRAPKQSKKI